MGMSKIKSSSRPSANSAPLLTTTEFADSEPLVPAPICRRPPVTLKLFERTIFPVSTQVPASAFVSVRFKPFVLMKSEASVLLSGIGAAQNQAGRGVRVAGDQFFRIENHRPGQRQRPGARRLEDAFRRRGDEDAAIAHIARPGVAQARPVRRAVRAIAVKQQIGRIGRGSADAAGLAAVADPARNEGGGINHRAPGVGAIGRQGKRRPAPNDHFANRAEERLRNENGRAADEMNITRRHPIAADGAVEQQRRAIAAVVEK